MAVSAVAKAALEAAAEVGKEVAKQVAKEGTQATKKAVSEELKKQVIKKVERDTLGLIDKNADPGDGTHTVTQGVRGSVDKVGQMGKGGQLENGQIDIKNLPIEDGPSEVKIDRPSKFPGETHGDEAIKKAEEDAINLVNGNTGDGDDGARYVTDSMRGTIQKTEVLRKDNNAEISIPETTKGSGADTDMLTHSGDVTESSVEKADLSEFTDIVRPPIDKWGIPETVKFPPPEIVRYLVPRNDGMTVHPTTDVPFVREEFLDPDTGEIKEGSFPEFDSIFETNLPEGLYEASDSAQFAECNKQLQDWVEKNPDKAKEIFTEDQLDVIKNNPVEVKLPDGKTIVVWKNPPGLTWHHNQKPGLMQLVDSKIHAATGHTGGQAIWGNRSKDTTKE